MARVIHWQIKFKSFNNVDCVVNIYKENATGPIVQLTGGDTPVYWEETAAADTLKVVRTKTGYISFIESTFGEYDDIYPTTATDRFVEVVYDGRVMFSGYLQPQTFENGWVAPPREIQIPIQSPLLAAQSITFDPVAPQMITLAQALKWAINKTGAPYEQVEMPTSVDLTQQIRASLLSPYNTNFNRSDYGETTPTNTPVDIYTFIEGLCNAYALIVHDTPDRLVFMNFNAAYNDTYWSYDVASLPDINRGSIALMYGRSDFDEHFMLTRDSNTVSQVMPLNEINFNFNSKNLDDVDMDFGRCKLSQILNDNSLGYSNKVIAIQQCMSDEISGPMLLTSNSIDSNHHLATAGAMVATISEVDENNGNIDNRSGILVQTTLWPSDTELFRVKIPVPISAPVLGNQSYQTRFGLKIKVSWAQNVQQEIFHSDNHDNFGLRIGWKFDNEPDPSTGQFKNVLVNGSTGEVGNTHHTSGLYIYSNMPHDYVTIIVRTGNMAALRLNELLLFESLGFSKYERQGFDELSDPPTDYLLKDNNGSLHTGEVSQFITTARYSRNMIGTTPIGLNTTSKYLYLLRSQKRFVLIAKLLNNVTYLYGIYNNVWRFSTPQGTVNTRALGVGFDPRNDEYSLIMQTFKTQ